jgi:ribosomal protein L17
MAKPNYQHMKKQKELARKARQQEKLTRKMARAQTETGDVKTVEPKSEP